MPPNARSLVAALIDLTAGAVEEIGFARVTQAVERVDDEVHCMWARRLAVPEAIQTVSLHTRYMHRRSCLVHLNIWFKLPRLYELLSQFRPFAFPPTRRDLVPDYRNSVAVRLNMAEWLPLAPESLDAGFTHRPDSNFKIIRSQSIEFRERMFRSMLHRQLVPVLQRNWSEAQIAELSLERIATAHWSHLPACWPVLANWSAGRFDRCLKLIAAYPDCFGPTATHHANAAMWFRARGAEPIAQALDDLVGREKDRSSLAHLSEHF